MGSSHLDSRPPEMNRRFFGIGTLVLLGSLVAYYVIPLVVIIITLGVICPYSPLGIPMCKATNSTETDATSSAPRPTPRTKAAAIAARLCKKPGDHYAGANAAGDEVCFTLTPDQLTWLEVSIRFGMGNCPDADGGYTTKTSLLGPGQLTTPGQIDLGQFMATISGMKASVVYEEPESCGGKRFEWSARHAP